MYFLETLSRQYNTIEVLAYDHGLKSGCIKNQILISRLCSSWTKIVYILEYDLTCNGSQEHFSNVSLQSEYNAVRVINYTKFSEADLLSVYVL